MKTSYKGKTTGNEKKRSSFWEFLGGEFLLHRSVVRWYPYVLLLFVLAAITVFNEKSIASKTRQVDKLYKEAKDVLSELKSSNQVITYDTNQKLIKILEERGFSKKDQNVFKIPVKINIEEKRHDR